MAALIIETKGSVSVALADRKAELVPDKGITVEDRKDEDSKELPEGLCRFTVASPAGYLHMDELDPGVYRLAMGDAPEVEAAPVNAAPMDMDDHLALIDALVKERDAEKAEVVALTAQVVSLGAVPVKPTVKPVVVKEG